MLVEVSENQAECAVRDGGEVVLLRLIVRVVAVKRDEATQEWDRREARRVETKRNTAAGCSAIHSTRQACSPLSTAGRRLGRQVVTAAMASWRRVLRSFCFPRVAAARVALRCGAAVARRASQPLCVCLPVSLLCVDPFPARWVQRHPRTAVAYRLHAPNASAPASSSALHRSRHAGQDEAQS